MRKTDRTLGPTNAEQLPRRSRFIFIIVGLIVMVAVIFIFIPWLDLSSTKQLISHDDLRRAPADETQSVVETWPGRAREIVELFHNVYTACWEGAYGAIGEAYLFAATHDSSLLRFHTIDHDLKKMCAGTWVDDRAWVCLAEFFWWDFTGRTNFTLIDDARNRYVSAREEGRLSHHDGYWSWYNWAPQSGVNEQIFTNSNMNQMITVACWLYRITGEKRFRDDALLVWNGDKNYPGVEKMLYKGNGVWEGKKGRAAFGKEVPWAGAGYCTIGAAMYRMTNEKKYKDIVVATARRIMDPSNGWVDPQDYYQLHMDGNGAFVNFLLDAYAIAPDELSDIPVKIERMLEHVWTNNNGMARFTLHRETDHGIRNGWNPNGGEDGYGVDEVGTVHAQGEAVRAFGTFVYYYSKPHP